MIDTEELVAITKISRGLLLIPEEHFEGGVLKPATAIYVIDSLIQNDLYTAKTLAKTLAKDHKVFFPANRIEVVSEALRECGL